MKDYLTVVEFAAAGITKQAVYKRIKQDLAPYVKSKTEKRLYQNSGHEKDVTIEWIVLDVKANVALLVSKNVLEAIPYHSEQKKVDSEKSSIQQHQSILGPSVWTTLLRRLKKKPMVAIRLMSTTMLLFQRTVKRP